MYSQQLSGFIREVLKYIYSHQFTFNGENDVEVIYKDYKMLVSEDFFNLYYKEYSTKPITKSAMIEKCAYDLTNIINNWVEQIQLGEQ